MIRYLRNRWLSDSYTAALALACTASSLFAQAQWTELPPQLRNREGHTMVTDDVGGVTILFGGTIDPGTSTYANDVWTFDGSTWTEQASVNPPPARKGHAAVFDSARGKMVIFGGSAHVAGSTVSLNDTWEWDGVSWTQVNTTMQPTARERHTMAYMLNRQETVMTGGTTGWSETWVFDGTAGTWTQAVPAGPAPNLQSPTLTYDGPRGVSLLVGAAISAVETWEWDGTVWTQQAPPINPPAVYGHTAHQVSLPGAPIIMFGGFDGMAMSSATWQWDGSAKTWTALPVTGPAGRLWTASAMDPLTGGLLLFGGNAENGTASDTWRFDGTSWQRVGQGQPPGRTSASFTMGPAGTPILFGGLAYWPFGNSNTWSWDGSEWTELTAAGGPSSRYSSEAALDTSRGQIVMFGGIHGFDGSFLGDTWEFDGAVWNQVTPTNSPPPRAHHAMAYDRDRDVTVLHGGSSGGAPFTETWEYDGTTWTQRVIAQPSSMTVQAMAYDLGQGVCVLLGQNTFSGAMETWQYDGTAWSQLATAIAPPNGDAELDLEYDEFRDTMVVIANDAVGASTWELDLAQATPTWSMATSVGSNPNVTYGAIAYDSVRQVVVQYGGHVGMATGPESLSTFEYAVATPATVASVGTSCSGVVGTPVCSAAPGVSNVPWMGTEFTTQVDGLTGAGILVSLAYGLTPYPGGIELSLLNLPGCFLYHDHLAVVPLTSDAMGTVAHGLTMSSDPALIGSKLYAQAFVSGVSGFLDSTSNALELTMQLR